MQRRKAVLVGDIDILLQFHVFASDLAAASFCVEAAVGLGQLGHPRLRVTYDSATLTQYFKTNKEISKINNDV